MRCLNEVTLVGNLTADPELRYTTGGAAVANLRVATNRKFTDKAGNKQEKAQFHKVIVWSKLAESCGQFLKKGNPVLVKGEIDYREYEKDGVKHYVTEINANDVIFLPTGQARAAAGAPPAGGAPAGNPIPDDDIPF